MENGKNDINSLEEQMANNERHLLLLWCRNGFPESVFRQLPRDGGGLNSVYIGLLLVSLRGRGVCCKDWRDGVYLA